MSVCRHELGGVQPPPLDNSNPGIRRGLLLTDSRPVVSADRITTTETYHKYSQNLIVRSQVERESSEKLRSDIDCFLRTSAKEMWNRFNQVNTAILARIQEVTNARNRLQVQLEKVYTQSIDRLKLHLLRLSCPVLVL